MRSNIAQAGVNLVPNFRVASNTSNHSDRSVCGWCFHFVFNSRTCYRITSCLSGRLLHFYWPFGLCNKSESKILIMGIPRIRETVARLQQIRMLIYYFRVWIHNGYFLHKCSPLKNFQTRFKSNFVEFWKKLHDRTKSLRFQFRQVRFQSSDIVTSQ